MPDRVSQSEASAPTIDILRVIAERQRAGVGREQWVRGQGLSGSRLAALERRGLLESKHMNASWNLSRRYDVTWRLTPLGWERV